MSYGEAQRNVGDALHMLEMREVRRVKPLEGSAQRETKQIEIKERRLEVEKETRLCNRELTLHRKQLEEKRVQNEKD